MAGIRIRTYGPRDAAPSRNGAHCCRRVFASGAALPFFPSLFTRGLLWPKFPKHHFRFWREPDVECLPISRIEEPRGCHLCRPFRFPRMTGTASAMPGQGRCPRDRRDGARTGDGFWSSAFNLPSGDRASILAEQWNLASGLLPDGCEKALPMNLFWRRRPCFT